MQISKSHPNDTKCGYLLQEPLPLKPSKSFLFWDKLIQATEENNASSLPWKVEKGNMYSKLLLKLLLYSGAHPQK